MSQGDCGFLPRKGGGGKAESTPWRGPAGAQRPPLGGGYSALGTRGQSPWCSHTQGNGAVRLPHLQATEAISLPQPQRGTNNGTLARRDADGRRGGKQSADKAVAPSAQRRQSKRMRVRRSHGKERGKSASGSAQGHRPLTKPVRSECDYRQFPLNCSGPSGPPLRQRSSPAGRDTEGGSVEQTRADGFAE